MPSDSFEALIRLVKARNSKVDVREIQRAYALAERSHQGQQRLTGEPFIVNGFEQNSQ